MKAYLISLAVGLAVGFLYAMLNVRSPAPPVIALMGLLGILLGEQVPTVVRHLISDTPAAVTWFHQIKPHVFGSLPSGQVRSEIPHDAT
jgi:XapX domain-containing protein